MTGGTWTLSTSIRLTSVNLPANQPKGAKLTLADAVDQLLTYGTASGKGNIFVFQTRSLAAGASATYDLYTGTDLLDVHGDTAALRKLKSLFIWVDSGGDTAGVTIGGAASNAHTLFFSDVSDLWTIYPSGPAMAGGRPAGTTVDATNKNLKILNNGAVSVVVGIALAGSSA